MIAIYAMCDKCYVILTTPECNSEGGETYASNRGWRIDPDGKDYCPNCVEKREGGK